MDRVHIQDEIIDVIDAFVDRNAPPLLGMAFIGLLLRAAQEPFYIEQYTVLQSKGDLEITDLHGNDAGMLSTAVLNVILDLLDCIPDDALPSFVAEAERVMHFGVTKGAYAHELRTQRARQARARVNPTGGWSSWSSRRPPPPPPPSRNVELLIEQLTEMLLVHEGKVITKALARERARNIAAAWDELGHEE